MPGAGRYSDHDVEHYDRPRRRTRPRTKERPTYDDAVDGVVVTVDRGRFTLLVDGTTVLAMKARPLGRKGVVVGDRVRVVGDVSGEDGTLARIVALIRQAESRRAPIETFVQRFARAYTPIVTGLAVLVMIVPPLLGYGAGLDWFIRGVTLLVIACPCALVIATPVTVVSALTSAARRGVLIKSEKSSANTETGEDGRAVPAAAKGAIDIEAVLSDAEGRHCFFE